MPSTAFQLGLSCFLTASTVLIFSHERTNDSNRSVYRLPGPAQGTGNVWQPYSAHNAGHIGFNNSGELADIKMTLFTMTVIVNRTGFTTGRTSYPGIFRDPNCDGNRTGVFIKRKRFNLPWSGQVENMSVEGLFVHGGDLWQLKYHHHAFSHYNKGSPI